MANSDKDIRVVPNRNKSGLPNIAFTGYNNDPIVLNVLDDNTISFEGSSGQLFSVSNAVTTGTIFSVNDISGIPSFRVDADGTVGIAEFSGNVGIGLQSPQSKLSVGGDINVGAGYTFRVAGTKVLDSSSLGTGVTGSSLTSVGTISSGTWQGTAIGVNYGGTGATNASDSRSFLGAATAGTNSDITRLLGVQHLFVTIPTAAAIGITVKAATSQAASMMEFVNSSNSLLAWITKDGTFSHGAYFTHSDGRVPGFSVQRANAAGIVARGFNSDAFPAIEVQNNPGSLMVGLYPGGLVYGGVLQAWASTASTNTTTGALIVAGGAAIAGTTNFGRDVRIFSSLASSSPFTGSLVVSGGVGISNNLFVGGGVAFTSSIASTSTATGTLVVTGGVGIGGSVFTSTSNASSISGVVLSDGSVTLTGTYTQSNSSTTAFQVRDGSNNPAFVIDTIGDVISLPVAVASTSTGTGSLVVAGGVGIGQSVNIGGKLDVSNTINYVATNSGIANTWTRIAIPSPVSISGLTYGNGLYVGVGYSAATSTDGITWTARSLPHNLTTVRYGNNLYVGVNYGSALGATSTDGITWRSMSLPSSANWDGIAYGNGIYVITATYNNNLVAYSYNGFQWTLGSLPIPGGGFFVTTPVIFGGGYFYTGSYSGVYYFTSVDGINWTLRTGLNYVATNTSCYGDGTWLLTGSSASLAYTKDLTNWTYGSHYGWSGSANLGAYTNGTFAIVDFGSLQCTLIYKNLSTVVLSNLPGPSYATTITAGEGKFIAGAGSTVYVTDVASHTYNIFPHNSGEINNVRIGAKFPSAAQFTVLNATSLVSFGATTPSISTSTGALVVRGGVGIGGSLFVGNTLSVASSTASTSTTTGALVVSGGVGIGGSIYTDSSISVGTLSTPSTSGPVYFALAGLASTGNLNASTTYYYKISAIDYTGGESLPSNESSVTLTGSQNAVRVTANAQPGVLGYRIYRTTSSGIYTTSYIATTYPSNASANVNQALTYYFYDFGITASAIAPVSTSTFRPVSINRSTYSNFANVNIHRGNLVVNTPNYSTFTNESIEVGNGNQIFVKDHTSFYLGSLTASTGGTLTNGTTYYYKFSAVDFYNNETFTGREFAATAGTGGAITLNFAGADQNVAALRIYRSTTPGNFTNSYLGQFSTSFTDINYPTSNTSPPTVSSARALYLSSRPDLESFIPNIKVTPGGNSGNFIKTLGGSPEPTVTVSGTAGSLIPGTTYYYKAEVRDIFGNSAFQSDAISVGIGTYTSTNVGVSGVDWPYAYARFLVFRSTNRNNFSNSTYYILNPGQTYNDIGDAGYTGTPSSSDNFKIAQIGVANYGFPTNYLRNLVLGTGGNSDQMTAVNGTTGLPTLQAAVGGTLVNGQTYYYRVEAQDVFNYSAFSSPPVKIVADSGGAVRITFSGTSSQNMLNKWSVFRSTSLTNWSNSLLQYHIAGTAFTDYGWATVSGSPNDSSDRSVSFKLNSGRMTLGDIRTQGFIIRQDTVYNITTTPGIGGSLSNNTTYYYRIAPMSWGNYNSMGQLSDEIVVSTGSTQNSITLSWNSSYGPCAYNVYRTTTRGSYSNVPYYTVTNTSFVDNGQTTLTNSASFDVFYPGSTKEMIHSYYGNNLSHLTIAGESSFLKYAMQAPRGLSATTGTGGTLSNNTTYFYVVEAYDYGNNRTLVSNPVQIDTGANNSVTLSWNEVLGASYYKVYRNASLGSFTNSLINVVIKSNSFTDINYPVSNTSPSTNPKYAGSTLFVSSYNNNYSLFAPRTIIQGVPSSQGIYATDFLLRLAAYPARSIYGSLLELGDYSNDGYNGSSDGTYLGIASSTGFSGDYVNFQASSVSRFKINNLGNTTIGSTTGSGSTSTGALVISGGVGIGQSLFTSPSYSSSISGAIFSNGSATLSGTFTQNNSSTTAFQVRDGSNNAAFVIDTISDIISLPVAVASTSTGTGSLVVAGGVGIGQSINIGGRVGIGTNLLNAALNIQIPSTTTSGIILRGNTSQSADSIKTFSAAGDTNFAVSANGRVVTGSGMDVLQSGTVTNLFDVSASRINWNFQTWQYSNIYWVTAGSNLGQASGQLQFSHSGTSTVSGVGVVANSWSTGGENRAFGILSPNGSERSFFRGYGNLVINPNNPNGLHTAWNTMDLITLDISGTATTYSGNIILGKVEGTERFSVGPFGNTKITVGTATSATGLIVKAVTSQTGNLFEAQSSTGATLTFIDASGNASVGGTLNISGNASIGGTLNVSGSNSYFQNNLYVGNNTQGRLYFSQATLGSAGTTVIPTMAFIGATNSPITLSVLPDNSLSFDGSSGQLFSINNNLSTGWIFSINDISGLPIFRTNADLTVAMGEYGGNVGIGLSNPTFKLQVSGNAGISGTTLISNTTTSTNTTSGALVVSGGVGIGGSLNVTSASTISGVTINSGVITGSLTGTATTATYSNQSGYAITSGSSNTSGYATTSGLATTATYSHQSGYAITSGSANTALYSDQSGYGLTSGLASTATYAHQSGYAITSGSSNTSGYATTSGLATTATNVNIVSASTSASHPVLFTPASGTASGAALSIESTFVYNPSTDILSVSGLAITSGTASTSTSTGALVVAGGVGISGSLYVGSSSDFYPAPEEFTVAGFAKSADNIYFVIKNSNTDPAFDTSAANIILAHSDNYAMIGIGKTVLNNGALLISSQLSGINLSAGGNVSIQALENIYHNTEIGFDHRFNVDGINVFSIASTGATFYNTTASTASTNGALQVSGGVGIGKTSYFGQDVKIQGTTGSASTTTGALVVTGGVGIALTSYFGQDVKIQGTTASIGPTTGALVVSGGVGIGGSLHVGTRSANDSSTYGNVEGGFGGSFIGNLSVAIRNFYPNIINKSRLILGSDSGYSFIQYSSSANFSAPNRLEILNQSGDVDYRAATGYSHYFKIGTTDNFGSLVKMAITGTQVSIAQTTASTSSTTGGLIVSGGVGIGGSLFTSTSNASSISGVILNNGAITNSGTITSTGVMTLSNSSTTAFQVRDGSNNPAFTIDTIGDIITLPVAIASTTTGTGSLVVAGGVGIGQSVSVGGRLQLFNSANYTAFVSSASGNTVYTLPATSPATGTSVLQSTSAGVMSWVPLAAGSGTVSTLTAGTGISFSTGATITTTGTIRARRPLVTSFCAGYTPAASGADSVVIRLPDSPSDGTSAITYEPQEFHIRVETASATTTTIQLEKYTGTGAFSGTAITSVSISGGSTYEAQTSVFAGAGIFLTSGDKLRINFTALSASHANFSVYLELEEV